MLIQVPQRGCCGVCSGRRHPQRKSSIFVVVFLDSAYRSVSTRGHGRRCESNRFEKVRTIENHTDLRRDSPGETLIRSLHCNNSFKSYRVVASQSSVLFAVLTRNKHTHTHTHTLLIIVVIVVIVIILSLASPLLLLVILHTLRVLLKRVAARS